MTKNEKINVRGVEFDNVTMDEAVSYAWEYIESDSPVGAVFTPNAEIVQMCVENNENYELINSAALVLPDGSGVVKAAKILGTPLKEKVAGVEFGEALVRTSHEHSAGIFFLGGKPGVAETAVEKLREKYPGTVFCGTHDGYFDKSGEENDKVIDAVNASGAKILFVCFGVPAQEKWIAANKDRLTSVRLCLALGGSLDVYAGTVKRAPKIFIKLGLEWFYRLLCQPSRIGRMMALPRFLIGTYKEKAKNKKK